MYSKKKNAEACELYKHAYGLIESNRERYGNNKLKFANKEEGEIWTQCKLNAALCLINLKQYQGSIEISKDVNKNFPTNWKASYRLG